MLSESNKRYIRCGFIALFVIIIDQISKYYIMNFLKVMGTSYEAVPFLDIVFAWNRGITFGFLNNPDQNQLIFIVISLIIIVLLSFWLYKTVDYRFNIPISAVIGGALGNIIDRVRFGAVFDFLDFHFRDYHYPAFNIADACIVIGAILLIYYSFKKEEQE